MKMIANSWCVIVKNTESYIWSEKMKEIVDWICPVCASDDGFFRENEGWRCINCDSVIPDYVVFVVNRLRREIKKSIAKKTYRKSKKVNK
jgi:ribosomal protein L37AE/L43A